MTRTRCARAFLLLLVLTLLALPASAAGRLDTQGAPEPASFVNVFARLMDEFVSLFATSTGTIDTPTLPSNTPSGDSQGTMDPNG